MSEHIFQSFNPPSGLQMPLYEVPLEKRATVRIICTNRGDTTSVTVSVSPVGNPYNSGHDIVSGEALLASKSITTAPLMLRAGDIVRVSAGSDAVNFHCTGLLQNED